MGAALEVPLCAWCRSPLNDGALVCHACARRQPASDAVKRFRRDGALTIAACVAIVAIAGYYFWQQSQREDAIADAKIAASFCAPNIPDAEAVKEVTDLHADGMSWSDAATSFRRLIGCYFGN